MQFDFYEVVMEMEKQQLINRADCKVKKLFITGCMLNCKAELSE